MKRIVFLYTELAGYTMACLKAIPEDIARIDVVRYPVNSEAPFEFDGSGNIHLHDRDKFSDDELITWLDNLSPDILLVSGWIDKTYLRAASHFSSRISVVLLLDNPWSGSLRQWAGVIAGRFSIRQNFTHAWVPGPAQHTFAKRLGFPDDRIRAGFYCADRTLFEQYFGQYGKAKKISFPHRLLYVGRYLEFKGVADLWQAFAAVSSDFPDWELICAGTGEMWNQRLIHDKIIHRGFVQPHEMGELIRDTSWFVLPSHREPWGVVVQEMATAGMPMILSDAVSAGDVFLRHGENGYSFCAGSAQDLQKVLRKAMSATQDEMNRFQDSSRSASDWVTSEKWVKTLFSLMHT